jgi:ABC-2 type transport system ATP-binding protein
MASRGPDYVLPQITTPTLLLQGTVDTLFPLREAVANYRALSDSNVPVKMVWFCGGHGVCLTSPGCGRW